MCQVYVVGANGKKYKLGEPTPRMTLETTNKLFGALDALAGKIGRLRSIYVEPVEAHKI
jgi:hypothetical protein